MNNDLPTPRETSARQMEANRENSLKSTGPKTDKGKATSKMNAVKHGMLMTQVVVRGLQIRERSKNFQGLREQLYQELVAVGMGPIMLKLRNEANFSRCLRLHISFTDNWLSGGLSHFVTWLRFAGLASFQGVQVL
jgi:hypothetical protein